MVRWQKEVFIHTRLSRAYLALVRLSCFSIIRRSRPVPNNGRKFASLHVWISLIAYL